MSAEEEVGGLVAGLLVVVLAGSAGRVLWLLFHGRLVRLRLEPAADRREPPLWSGIEVLLVLSTYFLGQMVFGALLSPLHRAGHLSMGATSFAVLLLSALLAIWVVWSRLGGSLGQPIQAMGFAATPARNYGVTLVAYLLGIFPVALVAGVWQLLLSWLLPVELDAQEAVQMVEAMARQRDWVALGLLALAAVVLAPIIEETLFRGLLFGWLRVRWGLGVAAWVSGGAFALVHGSLLNLAPLWFLGTLLSLLVEKTRSLYPAMLYHAVFNLVTLVLLTLRTIQSP